MIVKQTLFLGLILAVFLLFQFGFGLTPDQYAKPPFLIEPTDVTAIEGSDITLPCVLVAEFKGCGRWFTRFNHEICAKSHSSNRFRMKDNKGDVSLTIYNVSAEDSGPYQCLAIEAITELPVYSGVANVFVLAADLIKVPEFGEDFIRYIAMEDIVFTCKPDPSFGSEKVDVDKPTTIDLKDELNDKVATNAILTVPKGQCDTGLTCELTDQLHSVVPRLTISIKISSPCRLELKLKFGSKYSDELLCFANKSDPEVKNSYNCYRSEAVKDYENPFLVFNWLNAPSTENIMICEMIISTLSEKYTFNLSFEPTCPPGAFVLRKLKSVELSDNENQTCKSNETDGGLNLEIFHSSYRIPIEVPIEILRETKSISSIDRQYGGFKTTCYYWFWQDQVVTVTHNGILLLNLCKVVTLGIQVTVHDLKVYDVTKHDCIVLNLPKRCNKCTFFNMCQNLPNVPAIYIVIGFLTLVGLSALLILFIVRRLLFKDADSKEGIKSSKSKLTKTIANMQSSRNEYTRFMNDDGHVSKNKMTFV